MMRRWSGRIATAVLSTFVGAMAAVAAIAVIWIVAVDDPLGGEPVAAAAIERALPGVPKAADAAAESASVPLAQTSPATDAGATREGSPESGPLIIKVPPAGASAPASARDPDLTETSRYGPIPRIGADGTRPFEKYARSTVAEADDKRPKIALVIGGLGASREATASVFEHLPRSVTLAFTPYSSELESWVAKARTEGYEFLIQVPMEPFDYPNNDPGPQALLTGLPTEANIDRLTWAMSRASGYYGLTNFMGAKFLGTESALQPVLTEIGRRGLVYLDDGTVSQSLASRIGPQAGTVTARARIVIDAVPEGAAIQASLRQLEELARRTGGAIGYAGALPVTLLEIEKWAAHLTAKGIALVPVSAVVKLSNPS